MKRQLDLLLGAAVVTLIGACSTGEGSPAISAINGQAPMFEVDPFWPQPLPNHWLQGATIGVAVDSRDHVFLVHRNTPDQFAARPEIGLAQDPPLSECCQPAPPVLEFDPDGNLVNAWGGPPDSGEYEWPASNHGIVVDHMDNIWIGGNGGGDAHVLKFTRDGTFIMQIGKEGARASGETDGRTVYTGNSHDTESFGRVAKISFEPNANEMFLADGYLNKRVAVIDATTGEFKRYWGAYGDAPDDGLDLGRYSPDAPPASQFRGPVHCAEPSNDGLLYVCDRASDRIQVFQLDGTYVSETFIAPATLSQGSTWDIAFSPDDEQTYIYLADGQNMKVYIILRETMEVLTSFGDGGRQPGLFFAVHSIATDSQGNIYTTETYEGKRIQKFNYMGMGPVVAENQGAPWPGN
jgi:DNA-binding beta-propeller fold protein YncE